MWKYLIPVFMILVSCSSIDMLKDGKGSGVKEEYSVSYKEAWQLSKSILKEHSYGRSLTYDTENNYMASPVSNGFIGIWIDEVEPQKVLITAYSRRESVTYVSIGLSASKFHTLLKKKIRG